MPLIRTNHENATFITKSKTLLGIHRFISNHLIKLHKKRQSWTIPIESNLLCNYFALISSDSKYLQREQSRHYEDPIPLKVNEVHDDEFDLLARHAEVKMTSILTVPPMLTYHESRCSHRLCSHLFLCLSRVPSLHLCHDLESFLMFRRIWKEWWPGWDSWEHRGSWLDLELEKLSKFSDSSQDSIFFFRKTSTIRPSENNIYLSSKSVSKISLFRTYLIIRSLLPHPYLSRWRRNRFRISSKKIAWIWSTRTGSGSSFGGMVGTEIGFPRTATLGGSKAQYNRSTTKKNAVSYRGTRFAIGENHRPAKRPKVKCILRESHWSIPLPNKK